MRILNNVVIYMYATTTPAALIVLLIGLKYKPNSQI